MSSIPPVPLLNSLVEALLAPDRALHNSMSLGDSKTAALQHLNGQRSNMLSQLVSSPVIEEAFPGSAIERNAVLGKLWDSVIAAANHAQPGSDLPAWFGVLQKLSAQSAASSHAPVIELVMYNAASHVGEQWYLRLADAHDELYNTVRAYQLQNRLSGQGKNTANRIVQEVLIASGGATGKWGNVDWSAVEAALSAFFEHFVAQPPRSELASSLAFLAGFLRRVVAVLELPHGLWALLLMRMDVELSKLSSFGSHSFVSDIVEPLIAGAHHLGVVGELMRGMQTAQSSKAQIGELIAIQAVMGFAPDGRLASRWLQRINIAGLRQTGLDTAAVGALAKAVVESMRQTRERHELDVLDAAAAVLSNWLRGADAAEAIALQVKNANDSLASQLVEGAADTAGKTRVAAQIEAILKVCIHAAAIGADPTRARAIVRRHIALYLNTTKDIQVWKRHREIAARLAQLEISQSNQEHIARALATLAPEIEQALSDQLKIKITWLGAAKPITAAKPTQPGTRADDLQILIARYALFRRLHGSAGVIGAMNRWYCTTLFSFPGRIDCKAVAVALADQIAARELTIGCDSLLSEFQMWVQQIHKCTAARNMILSLDKIVETTIQYGSARYAQRVAQNSAPMPPGGVETAWKLGRLDCAWTLGRLSHVVCSEGKRGSSNLWFWWQIGVGKNISRVPQAFVKAYLQALSEALDEHTHQDEADWIFAQIFACYQRMFGLRQAEGNAELEVFAPLTSTGQVWQQEIGAKPAASTFAFHNGLLMRCCPAALQALAQDILLGLTQVGDEEVFWQRQMPSLIAAMEGTDAASVLANMTRWQMQGTEVLPLGTGALWHVFMTHGCQILTQCSYGYFLAKNRTQITKALTIYCPEVFAQYAGRAELVGVVEKMMGRLGMTLMSEPPTLAAMNTVRILMWARAQGMNLDRQSWRKLWSTLDAVLQPSRATPARQGSSLWTLQLMACCDELVKLDAQTNALFVSTDLVFAETQSEELRWRLVLGGLVASALMPDYAPVNGKGTIGRLFLSCDAFAQESPITWTPRGQALLGLFGADANDGFKSRLAERIVQLGALLYDKSRFQEMPSVNANFRYCVLMSGLAQARMLWGNILLARYVDERKATISAEEAFIGNQLREPSPDPLRATSARTFLSMGNRYQCPESVERKKLLGREKLPLGDEQRVALTLAVRSYTAHDFMSKPDLLAPLRRVADAFTGNVAKTDGSNVLEIWLQQTQELAKESGWDGKNVRADLGNAMAAARLLASSDPAKQLAAAPNTKGTTTTTSILKVQDAPVTYLAASLNHLWQRPAGLNAWLFMSEEVVVDEWPDLRQALQLRITNLAAAKGALPSTDVQEWGQIADPSRQAVAR